MIFDGFWAILGILKMKYFFQNCFSAEKWVDLGAQMEFSHKSGYFRYLHDKYERNHAELTNFDKVIGTK